MAKTDPKTMRFEEDIANYIEKQPGDNFSQKFHNLVEFFMKEETKYKAKLTTINKQIEQQQEQYQLLKNKVQAFARINDRLPKLDTYYRTIMAELQTIDEDITKHLKPQFQPPTPTT